MRLLLLLSSLVFITTSALEQPEVLVYTVATEKTDGLKRLLASAETFNINVNVLALGEEWRGGDTRVEQGGGQKIRLLREALEKHKDKKDTIVLFVDAYDVVFTSDLNTILSRFFEHFEDKKVLFGAEPFCWPDQSLSTEYPLVDFGKRYLNSGLFMGYVSQIYEIVSFQEVADNDDDQLYYTHIYLDEKLRRDLAIGLDSMSRIFQNLNGVVDDVELQFDDNGDALAYNAAYNTHPAIIHGNGPSKKYLNYLTNYLAKRWSSATGCFNCGDKSRLDLSEKSEEDLPLITVSFVISKPIPFVEEVLKALSEVEYPKSRIALYVFNNQKFNIKTVLDFVSEFGKEYHTKKIINGDEAISERDARNEALDFAERVSSDYLVFLDADVIITDKKVFHSLIEYSVNYDIGIVGPFINQPGKLFSNFWGAIASNGYYARSEDYMAIVHRKRKGYFNVPFLTSLLLLNKEKISAMKGAFSYSSQIDADMSFCKFARDKGHFMYVDNEHLVGFLIINEDFIENVKEGRYHPEMYEIFTNRELFERRYLHPKYKETLESEEFVQPCPDVYDIPLMSERYAKEMIEEMEAYGQWSNGKNQDNRLAGGYENVPTRDIHMNQINYERHWLYFLDEFVRPMQEKVFIGYFHKPVESHMMFVVRYKPTEQASLRPHHDASTYSIDIALNKLGKDYEGGGVRYVRYNCTVPADEVGYGMMFPGRLTHLHEGLPTTEGTRYILVSFLNP
ncbi:unnamed protein product [Auanema sp. JU1783]|nr:unnamed protein product [Auanema sp. JU1783]